MSRPVALLLALTMVALLPGAASAAAPIAGDDPSAGCDSSAWGGSFPIPEDSAQVAFVAGTPCGIDANDSDPDLDALSWALVTPPANGDLEFPGGSNATHGYTPDPDYFTLPGDEPGGDWLSDSWVYEVTAGGETDQATVRYWIAPVNDAPSFSSGGDVTVAEDSGAYSATWATAITEGPGESYQSVAFDIQVDTNGVPGLFAVAPAIAPNGTLTFTPAANKAGIATVTVILEDDGGLESYSGVTLDPPPDDASDAVEFDIIITAAPDAAVAVDDAYSVDEDAGATTLSVLGNDSDADGDPFVVTGVTQGGKGSVAIAPAGAGVVYDPDTNATGEDTFTYTITGGDMATVTVTIDPQNDPPTADDDAATVLEDAAATSIAVLVGDADPDGDTLDIMAVTQGTKGAVLITGGGTGLTYDPTSNLNGSDSFTYTISDGNGGSDTATVTMTITPQNDDPTADADTLTVLEDATATAVAVLVGDADIDGDTLTISQVTQGAKGAVVITGGGTGLTYDPATNATGSDAFTYTISDGNGGTDTASVTVTITAQNDDPTADDDAVTVLEDAAATSVAVLVGDADIDGDTLTITSKTNGTKGVVVITGGGTGLTYDPTTNLNGSDSFTYTISDGNGGTDTATVSVTITPQNDPPTADDDAVTVLEDAAATSVAVLVGDADIDGDALDITSVTQGSKGTVAITGGGTGLTYDPTTNLNGSDSFTYTISDGNGGSDTATVSVTITAQNDPPTADDDAITVLEDAAATEVPVLTGDADIDGHALDIIAVTQGAKGTVVITGGGTGLTYQPDADATGADAFTYTISDGNGGSDTASVTVTITAQNDPPTADDDSVTVLEDANATSVPVLVGDSDVEGDDLDIIAVTQGTKGTVVITGGGTGLTYKPGANTSGADAFTYTISDGNGGSDTATVTVTITPVQDDTPNAVNDSATIPTGPAVAIPVLANDTDLDGDPLTITSKTNGAHGAVVITGGGTGLTYDPAPLFSGTDQFTYTVFDGFVTDTATVLVTVLPDTAAPTLSGLAHTMPAQILGGSSPRVRFQWGGSDPGSGIANYHLQLSVNGGAFATVALSSPTATAYERALASNTTYQFRLRAKDKSGNISGFSSFASLNPVVLQEGTSLATYTGSWSTSTNASMSGGKGRFTSSSTRRVAFTFTGKGVGWVTTRTTSGGRAAVYLDGALITTIDLDASSIGYRRMVYRSTFATAGRHTLEIRPLGDGRVDIDAFVILR